MYAAASRRQQLTRAVVRKALETLQHGFNDFDCKLIYYASLVNDAYDNWYPAWARAVQVHILPALPSMLGACKRLSSYNPQGS